MPRIIISSFHLLLKFFSFPFNFLFFLIFTNIANSSTIFNTSSCTRQFNSTVLSPSPVNIRSYLILAMIGVTSPAFAFCKVGHGVKDGWIKLECTIPDPHCSKSCITDRSMRLTNAIGFKGKFYALSLQGTLAVIEVIDSHPRIPALSNKRAAPSVSLKHFREYFVESNGEILLAFLISRKSMNIVDGVEVYRLDIGNLTWIKVESLGDTTLFIGANCYILVLASKVGCQRNCVYFSHRSADDWCVYDMEINTISSGWSESSSSELSLSWDEPFEEKILNPVGN